MGYRGFEKGAQVYRMKSCSYILIGHATGFDFHLNEGLGNLLEPIFIHIYCKNLMLAIQSSR